MESHVCQLWFLIEFLLRDWHSDIGLFLNLIHCREFVNKPQLDAFLFLIILKLEYIWFLFFIFFNFFYFIFIFCFDIKCVFPFACKYEHGW